MISKRTALLWIIKRTALWVIVAATCSLSVTAPATSQPSWSGPPASKAGFALSPAERRGFKFVRLHCARCHAIDRTGESPLAIAPAFRTLHLKYPVSDLQRPLAQGIHPMMPRFQLETGQVEDIMAYLKALEQ